MNRFLQFALSLMLFAPALIAQHSPVQANVSNQPPTLGQLGATGIAVADSHGDLSTPNSFTYDSGTQTESVVNLSVSGTCTGCGGAGTSPVNPQSGTYTATSADFANSRTIVVSSGTFTITLVASGSQPANGQYINIVNYGSGTVTVARSGQNINGGTSSLTLAAASATAPTSTRIVSDGTNYFAGLDAITTANTCALPGSNGLVRLATPNTCTAAELSGDATTSGSNVVTNGKVNGVTYPASPSTHQTPVITAANTATYKTLPDCQDTGGNHLNYTQSSDAYSCGTSGGGGGGGAAGASLFSSTNSTTVTAAAATTLIGTVTGSTTVPANTWTAGALTELLAQGYYSTPAAARTLTINVRIGGSTRITTGAFTVIASVTNGTWRLYCGVTTRTTGVSGTQIANCIFEMSGSTLTPGDAPLQTSSTWTIDTTAGQAIDLQAAWDSTTGSPTITSTNVAAWIPGAPVTSVNGNTGAVTVSVDGDTYTRNPSLSGTATLSNGTFSLTASTFTASDGVAYRVRAVLKRTNSGHNLAIALINSGKTDGYELFSQSDGNTTVYHDTAGSATLLTASGVVITSAANQWVPLEFTITCSSGTNIIVPYSFGMLGSGGAAAFHMTSDSSFDCAGTNFYFGFIGDTVGNIIVDKEQ